MEKVAKRAQESFGEVIERLINRGKANLTEYVGARKDCILPDGLED
jgi:predicted CopG family antitoxin